ncbi:hypothetical protein SK128_027895, partial [Halocaridina rubra]
MLVPYAALVETLIDYKLLLHVTGRDASGTFSWPAAVIGGGTDADVNPFAAFDVSDSSGPPLPPQGSVSSFDTTTATTITTTTTSTTSTDAADLLGGLDPLAGVGTMPPAQPQ